MPLTAKALKERYTVYGSFYDLQTESQTIPCRNVLEIYDKAYHRQNNFTNIFPVSNSLFPTTATTGPLYQGQPDAIICMMNPGSSEPRQSGFTPPICPLHTAIAQIHNNALVFSKPDVTQYQIMRLMHKKQWHHARIINLSDIREPQSALFTEKAAALTKQLNYPLHSIFCDQRKNELAAALTPNDIPIILAWGQDPKLLSLAELCLAKLTGRRIIGIPSESDPRLYAHASPTLQSGKDKWLKQILLAVTPKD